MRWRTELKRIEMQCDACDKKEIGDVEDSLLPDWGKLITSSGKFDFCPKCVPVVGQ